MARREPAAPEETAAAEAEQESGRGAPRTPQERAERIVNWAIAELHKLAGVKGVTSAEIEAIGNHLHAELELALGQLRAINSQPFRLGSSSSAAAGDPPLED